MIVLSASPPVVLTVSDTRARSAERAETEADQRKVKSSKAVASRSS
jgi:hypothetical protein